MDKEIGGRIKRLREQYSENHLRENGTTIKFTQTDLASVMNVGQRQISKWENGEVDLSPEQIVKLSKFFNVSTDYILQGGDERNLVMMNETGLPESTILALNRQKETAVPRILSQMIEHRLFVQLVRNIEILCKPQQDYNKMFTSSVLLHLTKDLPYFDSPEDIKTAYMYSTIKIFEDIVDSIAERQGETNETGKR